MVKIKICGITTEQAAKTAIESGADFLGFVFYPKSPRHITLDTAKSLISSLPEKISKVGLLVDPEDQDIEAITQSRSFDYLQLHGHEAPERVKEIKHQHPEIGIIKSLSITQESDVKRAVNYSHYVDWFLFDAPVASLPGGNGTPFDWNLVKSVQIEKPWFLAGGLNAGNVHEAIHTTRPSGVDVSSGVECEPGKKDLKKIKEFITAAKER